MYEKQMSFFEDGGLYDEGGMTDPVSGNDVPPGSTRAEVRDDIPAMLSEGEFVMPADVVRYFGLEKLMEMRQEAKMGLKKMEAMGQMGNSEEATIPDDLPFSPEDLVIMMPQEMAQGGIVKAQQGAYMQPSGFTGSTLNRPNFIPPSSFSPTNPQGTATGYRPTFVGGNQQQLATAGINTQQTSTYTDNSLDLNDVTTGAGDSFLPTVNEVYTYIKYKNESTGEIRDIPFYFDEPVVPIPDGFVPYEEEDSTQTEDTTDTSVQTATVTDAMREREWGGPAEDQNTDMSTVPTADEIANMTEAELNDLANDVNNLSNLSLMGIANPVLGLIGHAIAKDYKSRVQEPIAQRAKALNIPNPLEQSKKTNIIDKIKNIFTQNKQKKEEEEKTIVTPTKQTKTQTPSKQAQPTTTTTNIDDETLESTFNFSDDDLAMAQDLLGNTQEKQDFKDDMMALAAAQNLSAEDLAMAQDVLGTPTPATPSLDEAITGIDVNESGQLTGGKDVGKDVVDAVATQAAISRAANIESKIGLDVFGPVPTPTLAESFNEAREMKSIQDYLDSVEQEQAKEAFDALGRQGQITRAGARESTVSLDAFGGPGPSIGETGTPSTPGNTAANAPGASVSIGGKDYGIGYESGQVDPGLAAAAVAAERGGGEAPGPNGNAPGPDAPGPDAPGPSGGNASPDPGVAGAEVGSGENGADAEGPFNRGGLVARKQKTAKRSVDKTRGVAARKKK